MVGRPCIQCNASVESEDEKIWRRCRSFQILLEKYFVFAAEWLKPSSKPKRATVARQSEVSILIQ